MSTFNEVDIECGQCGHEFRGTVWTAVHAGQDPELKELLLGGELNMVACPECSQVFYRDQFVLYQDPAAELVAYVYPAAQEGEADELREAVRRGYAEAQQVFEAKDRRDYEPLLLFGLESLVEMLEAEELRGEESQVAEAVCRENGIPTHVLRPSEARRLGVMRVLPRTRRGGLPDREELLEGLRRLLAVDPALSLYAELEQRIRHQSDFSLQAAS